jgi:hypothetical protein
VPLPDHQTTETNQKVEIKRMSERETWTSFLSLRTAVRAREAANVLPIIVGIRDGAVQLVSTLGSVVISA